MRILSPDEAFGPGGPDACCERVARRSPFGPLVLFLVFALGSGVLLVLLTLALHDAPVWGKALAGVILLPIALLMAIVDASLWSLFTATLRRRTSWWAATASDGLWLNLRSFGNAHFGTDAPTVVLVPWSEIAALGRVDEWTRTRDVTDGVEHKQVSKRLELVLRGGTEELSAALAAERARPAPERSFLGVRSRSRVKHWPVQVPAPGRVRIDWPGKAFVAALPEGIERLDQRPEAFGVAAAAQDPETMVRQLVERGMEIEAARLLRERTGCSWIEARRAVRRLAGEKASPLGSTGS